jgi:hypothetical protein
LGTGRIQYQKREYRSFDDAREFAKSLKLKTLAEWQEFAKSGKLPLDIPATPRFVYKEHGWKGFGDWLGTERVANFHKRFRPFLEARAFVHSLDLESRTAWVKYLKTGEKPADIPTIPSRTYKDQGWTSWGDWLGTGRVADRARDHLPFPEARSFVHGLSLRTGEDWKNYCRSGAKPENVPSNPAKTYRNSGWINMPDWLGADREKQFIPFLEAREYARSLGFCNQRQWRKCTKAEPLPAGVPITPDTIYRQSGWNDWYDWLGVGSSTKSKFRDFQQARQFVHALMLTSKAKWIQYCGGGALPSDIPKAPDQAYKNHGWISWGDWLGTASAAPQFRQLWTFVQSRDFVRALGLLSGADWKKYCKSGLKPETIPAAPWQTYKADGWQGMGDWLGTGRVATSKRGYRSAEEALKFIRDIGIKTIAQWNQYCRSGQKPIDIPAALWSVYKLPREIWFGHQWRDFAEARKFVRTLSLRNDQDWRQYCRSGDKPQDIPAAPWGVYSQAGWKSIGDWLGTDTIAPQCRDYLEFSDARAFARSLNITGRSPWRLFCRSGSKPDDVPANPDVVYKGVGWIGWGDWFGTGSVAPAKRVYRKFAEARSFAQGLQLTSIKDWRRYCKTGNKPEDIPSSPNKTYKQEGWVSWKDWLGSAN